MGELSHLKADQRRGRGIVAQCKAIEVGPRQPKGPSLGPKRLDGARWYHRKVARELECHVEQLGYVCGAADRGD